MSELTESRSSVAVANDDELAALVALAGLPGISPGRLWDLLMLDNPEQVWRLVAGGGAPLHGRARDAALGWADWCRRVDPPAELDRHRVTDTVVLPFGHEHYPDALLDDPEPPAVLFRRGPCLLDDRVRVAIVGTRRCTRYGQSVARDLGAALAQRGVDVVSGLASGIDAAAHAGAISKAPARTVAVVAGGVDIVYPKRNQGLYDQIGEHGALLSEWPLGCRPEPWRFPARNRVVAGLSAATVVVESAHTGGSMYTVDEALSRNRAVFAVPGSIHSPVSAGTNKLIADGALSLHDFDGLLDAVAPVANTKAVQVELGIESWLLEAVGWEPVELETVLRESNRSPSEVTLEVERLIGAGALRRLGGIVERVV